MTRVFHSLLLTLLLAAGVTAAGVVVGCTAEQVQAWKDAHPLTTTQPSKPSIAGEGAKLAPAAVVSASTGNPMPVINQLLAFAGWLLTVPATASAVGGVVKRRRQLAQVKAGQLERRAPRPPAGLRLEPTPPAAPAAGTRTTVTPLASAIAPPAAAAPKLAA